MAFGIHRARKRYYRNSTLLETDSDGYEYWDMVGSYPNGRWWIPAGSLAEIAGVLGEQEQDFYGDATCGVRRGDIVIDCGAHFGGFVKTALRRGAKLVVAVEFAPKTLVCLRRNCADELADGRMVIYEGVVWREPAALVSMRRMHCDAVVPAEAVTDYDRKVIGRITGRVAATTIDALVGEMEAFRCEVDFIKMDIEGAERHALAGAADTLRRHRPRLAIAAYHLPDDGAAIPAAIRAANPEYVVEPYLGGLALMARVPGWDDVCITPSGDADALE